MGDPIHQTQPNPNSSYSTVDGGVADKLDGSREEEEEEGDKKGRTNGAALASAASPSRATLSFQLE